MDYSREIADLFVRRIQYYKKEAEKRSVAEGVVNDGYVYVGGQPYAFDTISDRYLDDGSNVTVGFTNEGKAVVLG